MALRQLATATAVGLLLTGAAFAEGESIAVFTKNQTNPFWDNVRIGAASAAARDGASTVDFVPTQADSIPEQLSQIEDVIIRRPDAVVFVPVDYQAMVPGVERLNEAGIPVVTAVERVQGADALAFVGSSDYDLAKATAAFLYEDMGGSGKVVIIEGVPGSLTSQDRVRGFTDAMADFPGIELVAQQPANYQRLQGLQVMENLMQANPEIDAVLAANDAMAIGAMEALQGAGRTAKIIGINGSAEAVDAIAAGTMLASGDFNGFAQGCIATMIAVRTVRGEETPQEVLLQPSVINASNYEPFAVPVAERTCPTWDEVEAME